MTHPLPKLGKAQRDCGLEDVLFSAIVKPYLRIFYTNGKSSSLTEKATDHIMMRHWSIFLEQTRSLAGTACISAMYVALIQANCYCQARNP